ncbi:unnamed protein product [Rhizoctonia solani]|uniref:Uncharacterized protein n=1 Tax=Rhizoctonia solani TaxID=456999 RepID=A0A8H3DC13_9AGAM|nr:unnamed protein product [Rhizoctonia solani]
MSGSRRCLTHNNWGSCPRAKCLIPTSGLGTQCDLHYRRASPTLNSPSRAILMPDNNLLPFFAVEHNNRRISIQRTTNYDQTIKFIFKVFPELSNILKGTQRKRFATRSTRKHPYTLPKLPEVHELHTARWSAKPIPVMEPPGVSGARMGACECSG